MDALASVQDSGEDSAVAIAIDLAEQAHAAMVAANAQGRAEDAFRIAEALDPYASTIFADTPSAQHAIWNDFGALLFERGARNHAAAVLRSALNAHRAWKESNDPRPGIARKQDEGLLRTLATLISVLVLCGDLDPCDDLEYKGLGASNRTVWRTSEAALQFRISCALLLAAQGKTGEAENILNDILSGAILRDEVRLPLFRVARQLAATYVRRRRYDLAQESLVRARSLLDTDRFVQDAADLAHEWAILWYHLAAGDVESQAWRRAAAHNDEAVRLRASTPTLSPAAGCAEEALYALMALMEGNIAHGRRHLARCLWLAKSVWTLDDLALQVPLLTSAGFALAAGRPNMALHRIDRLLRNLDRDEVADREALLKALPVRAEALRRLGLDHEALHTLDAALDLESELVGDAITPSWTPFDVALVRRGHESLNAYIDAALAAGAVSNPHALFARVAASKDLGLRTLRAKRGATPPNLKRSTLAKDIAHAMPENATYIEFCVHFPRKPGAVRTGWGSPNVLAFTLNSEDQPNLRLHNLGAAQPLIREVKKLATPSENGRRRAFDRLSRLLRPVLASARGETVFIAADSFLHGLPFAALLIDGRRRWVETARLAMVESASAMLYSDPEGGTSTYGAVATIADVGAREPYGVLSHAQAEGDLVAYYLGAEAKHLNNDVGSADSLRQMLRYASGTFHLASHADVLRSPSGPGWTFERVNYLKGLPDPYAQSRIICGGFNAWASGNGALSDLDQVSLSAAELAAFDLRRLRLLTFGTCNGAAGETTPLESTASLATAARAAGAGTVVAAVWSVPDLATRQLMSQMYWFQPSTGSSVEALRQAQLGLLHDGVSAWAGFVAWAGPDDLRKLRRRPSAP